VAYAMIEDGRVEFHRMQYDIDETLARMRKSQIEAEIIDQTEQVLRNGGT